MSETVRISIDAKEYATEKGRTILEAARDNGVYIPTLCYFDGIAPTGTCRVCTVNVNGRPMAACTTPVAEGMTIENDTPELNEMRKTIIELLFVEGNHFCPSCEKSGTCDLQALAYRFKLMAPRFEYEFSQRDLDATPPKLIIERNRCILCKRCVKAIFADDGKALFAVSNRGNRAMINIDDKLAKTMSDELAEKAMNICPVGAIIKKGKGFSTPIGKRKYDTKPIGIENQVSS
ncbi:MAG: 2Fe-2S iron-sulfur cluster binding domain-containing protein [Chitinivibrionales bacterium]|nr:2Fe-2S iron-sulfur cluster binding domain-containing protein [Chitinivibrionales bacterium]MBD3395377.1 2Fe-2S iron-sulfur cluster binding domain-containing protein [Chitinivibrionales bacterium]